MMKCAMIQTSMSNCECCGVCSGHRERIRIMFQDIMEGKMGIQRECGVLLPISSLPSKYGIGCFSKSAYEFVDQLKAAGQGCWQILPLGPTSYGDSPYQSFSTFAGNPYFIDLKTLIKEGLLTKKECRE